MTVAIFSFLGVITGAIPQYFFRATSISCVLVAMLAQRPTQTIFAVSASTPIRRSFLSPQTATNLVQEQQTQNDVFACTGLHLLLRRLPNSRGSVPLCAPRNRWMPLHIWLPSCVKIHRVQQTWHPTISKWPFSAPTAMQHNHSFEADGSAVARLKC